ncbi:MAG: ATP-binding protein [Desulfobacterales bacterium]
MQTTELSQLNRQLRSEIAEKIRARKKQEKLQAQLYQAGKLEAIGTMAGGIAHDFNSVVGAILLNAELSIDDASDENEVRFCLEQILQVNHRSKYLIDQILTFSRKSEDIPKTVNIAAVAREAVGMLYSMIPPEICLETDISEDIGTIWANDTQLIQLILKLGTNAIHAMKNSGGKMIIALDTVKAETGYSDITSVASENVQITISDTGYGIDLLCLDKIFDPFFTTKAQGGRHRSRIIGSPWNSRL